MAGFITSDNRYYESDDRIDNLDVEVPLRPTADHEWNEDTFSWEYPPERDRRFRHQPQHIYVSDKMPKETDDSLLSKINLKTILPILAVVLPIVIPTTTALLKLYNDNTVLRTEFVAYRSEMTKTLDRFERQNKENQIQNDRLSNECRDRIDDTKRDIQDVLNYVKSRR